MRVERQPKKSEVDKKLIYVIYADTWTAVCICSDYHLDLIEKKNQEKKTYRLIAAAQISRSKRADTIFHRYIEERRIWTVVR